MYNCMWCLKQFNLKDLHKCERGFCDLTLCKKCMGQHREHHLAKENPVALLINNMINEYQMLYKDLL